MSKTRLFIQDQWETFFEEDFEEAHEGVMDPNNDNTLVIEVLYGLEEIDFEWVDVERYMGIYHGVQPAETSLRCVDCHGPDGRLDWTGLGYEADPLAAVLAPSH